MEEVIRMGNVNGKSGGSFAGQVYDTDGVAPTLTDMQGGGRQPHIVEIGYIEKGTGKHQSNAVYSSEGIAPTLCAGLGVKLQPTMHVECVAMRGRDPQNPSDRTAGNPNLEQRLETRADGCVNTLTTVQKDNMVMETEVLAVDEQNQNVRVETFGTLTTDGSSPKHNNRVAEIQIRQATKEGTIKCSLPGIADLNYPDSNTRRGRVIEGGQVCNTLTTENIPSVIEPWTWEIDGVLYRIRIRKLTPRECWRLMSFKDEDFNKAAEVNSNTQLYKEAGNSIVKNVLMEIFGQML